MTFPSADRTMAGDPDNNISPGSPAFQYDTNNRPKFAHSTPVANKKMDVDISFAESVIPSSTFVLPQGPAPSANLPAVKIGQSQDQPQMVQSPSRRDCHQAQVFSPGANAFSTSPANASSVFAKPTLFTPVKMLVCTNSKSSQMRSIASPSSRSSPRISVPRVVYDSRQYLRERNDRKIQHLVDASMQAGCNKNVSVQTSFLENSVEDGKRSANGSRSEYSNGNKGLQVRREIELRLQLDDWCKRHYIIDRMMPVIFMVLFLFAFAALFCPLNDMADVAIRIVNRM